LPKEREQPFDRALLEPTRREKGVAARNAQGFQGLQVFL
jgi:hypothetical protein